MNQSYKDILLKKYKDFDFEDNQERKKLLRFEILNILKNETNLNSDDYYIWGLTYYMSDDDKEYHRDLALEKFIDSYSLDSGNFMACLYTAHCYHDKCDYANALNYYELVNQEELKKIQLWRYVKLIEQIGFCNFKLGRADIGRQLFLEVLDWYRKLPSDDRVVPSEMLECLPDTDEIIIEMKKMEDYLT